MTPSPTTPDETRRSWFHRSSFRKQPRCYELAGLCEMCESSTACVSGCGLAFPHGRAFDLGQLSRARMTFLLLFFRETSCFFLGFSRETVKSAAPSVTLELGESKIGQESVFKL